VATSTFTIKKKIYCLPFTTLELLSLPLSMSLSPMHTTKAHKRERGKTATEQWWATNPKLKNDPTIKRGKI
jgi:hypothetical protein